MHKQMCLWITLIIPLATESGLSVVWKIAHSLRDELINSFRQVTWCVTSSHLPRGRSFIALYAVEFIVTRRSIQRSVRLWLHPVLRHPMAPMRPLRMLCESIATPQSPVTMACVAERRNGSCIDNGPLISTGLVGETADVNGCMHVALIRSRRLEDGFSPSAITGRP